MEIQVSHPNPQAPAASHQAFLPRASSPQSCRPRPVSFPHHVTHTVNLAFALVRGRRQTNTVPHAWPAVSRHGVDTMLQSPVQPRCTGEPLAVPWKTSYVTSPLCSAPLPSGVHCSWVGQFGRQVLTPNSAGPNSERVVHCTWHPPPPQASSRGGSFTAVCCHGDVAKSDPHGLEVVLLGLAGGSCFAALPH